MEAERSLSAENRRLEQEATELRERLLSVERSRWWKLHPRLAWRRVARAVRSARLDEPAIETTGDHEPVEQHGSTVSAFREEVVQRGAFAEDWFTENIPALEPLLRPLAGTRARILEIGSFEGLSTCFFLWLVPDAHVTAIDTFEGSIEHAGYGADVSELEARFDGNVARVDGSRVRKLVGDSRRVLLDLLDGEERFGFVYIDGSHLGLDVLVDAALSWQALDDGGVLVFDDYLWDDLGRDSLRRPGPAIDAFLALVEGKHEVLHRGKQVALRRTG